MASMGGSALLDPEPSILRIRGGHYINKLLSNICAAEGLKKDGVKIELQNRIIERIIFYSKNNDAANFHRLRRNIENPNNVQSTIGGMAVPPSPAINATNAYLGASNNRGPQNMGGSVNGYRVNTVFGKPSPRLEFKPSPFYSLETQLGEIKMMDVMQHHRHTVNISLKVGDHPILARVIREPHLKAMIFCAGEGQGRQDIAFPHQSEIKVNGGEVKANLRGLKNKPGSTRPVDITKDLRLNLPAYTNNVELTYALTQKKYYACVWVVNSVPVMDLVKKLEGGKKITERSVLDEMVSKARDPDIQTTASVLSLKCPLSTLRIDLPCRSISCRHNQCFDGTSYLQLQEQGPTWLCPVCNNPAPFESLAVDEYVKNILKSTPRSIDQVTVQPDGRWELHVKKEPARPAAMNGFASSDSDDDLVEITKSGDSVRMGTPQVFKTPGIMKALSREASTSSGTPRDQGSTSGKRPIAAVIDLTSSGDDDDEPIARPAKRQNNTNIYGTPSSAPAYRPAPAFNGYSPR